MKAFALAAAGALLIGATHAAAQPMVEWVIPALPTNKPQSAEQAQSSRERGRALPPPEVLQPMLDPALPAYAPRKERLTGAFKGAASDVMVEVARKWFEKFKAYHPDVSLTIAPPYAGSFGAVELVKGDLDFVFVSRELKPDDVKSFRAKFGYDPLSVPVSGGSYRHFGALDAVGFFVHKDNPLEKITFDQLDAMYSSTRHRGGQPITKWGDLGLGGEWADKPINLYGIKPWNGFEEFVRQRVFDKGGRRGEWRDGITFEKVVFPMAKSVEKDRHGIGYSGIAYIDAGVRMIPVVEKTGDAPQAATYENVALATYPLSRLTFLNTNKAPGKALAPALDEFLRFILSREGQQVVLDHASYIPLRSQQVRDARALFAK